MNRSNPDSSQPKPLKDSIQLKINPEEEQHKKQGFLGSEPQEMKGFPFGYPPGFENLNPNNALGSLVPQEDQNLNYYQEYCRLFIANVVLTTQMKELVAEKNELSSKLSKLEKKTEEYNSLNSIHTEEDRRKRFRRTAGEIDRHYKCMIETCLKSYGSEGSLNQHIKLKHPELYSEMIKNQTIVSQQHNSDEERSLSFDQSQNSMKIEPTNGKKNK